jgi:hypothetical protein
VDERARYKSALETIRDKAIEALKQIETSPEQRSMRWRCKDCRYTKHFTRPVPLERLVVVQDARAFRLRRWRNSRNPKGGENDKIAKTFVYAVYIEIGMTFYRWAAGGFDSPRLHFLGNYAQKAPR